MSNPPDQETDRELRISEALAGYFRQTDRHGRVEVTEYVDEHVEVGDELKELLETARLVEQMAGPVVASTPANTPANAAEAHVPPPHDAGSRDDALDETIAHLPKQQTGRQPTHTHVRNNPTFGDFDELEIIGQGGMGVVYRARQISLDRIVALKMIRSGVLAADRDIERFNLEAQAAGKLRHPNIVKVHQVGDVEGQHFFSMELVEGVDLAQLNRQEALSPKRIARILKTVAEAIHHAHQHQVVHRDLKPANILIDQQGRPLVTDFGLAKDGAQNPGLTSSGSSLGTPSYMSPEQAAGRLEQVDATSDVYSLGAILYELLAGQPPFKSNSTVDTILDVIHKSPVAPRLINRNADRQLEAICLKCLSKQPSQRYESAKQLAEDLGRYLNGAPILARPPNFFSSGWVWLRDVPLVAAVVGRRVTNPTVAHRVVQWLFVAGVIALLALPLFSRTQRAYPTQIRIASGAPLGEYHKFGAALSDVLVGEKLGSASALSTAGAVENLELLLADGAEAGLLQASAVAPFPAQLAVVAPLFQEYVSFVVDVESGIDQIGDLNGQPVIVGSDSSGMQQSAQQVVKKLSLTIEAVHEDFAQLQEGKCKAAIVTSGLENASLRRILSTDRFRMLAWEPKQILLLSELDVFRPRIMPSGSLGIGVPEVDVPALSTRTYLVVHKQANRDFVTDLLDAVTQLADRFQIESLDDRADWGPFPLHPAAKQFFDRESTANK